MSTYKGSETFSTEWTGVELKYPAQISYNLPMPIIDDDTVFEPGIHSGISNYMRVGETLSNGRTLVQFIEYAQITDNHVDKAKIVGETQLYDEDLKSLSNLLSGRLKKIQSKPS